MFAKNLYLVRVFLKFEIPSLLHEFLSATLNFFYHISLLVNAQIFFRYRLRLNNYIRNMLADNEFSKNYVNLPYT